MVTDGRPLYRTTRPGARALGRFETSPPDEPPFVPRRLDGALATPVTAKPASATDNVHVDAEPRLRGSLASSPGPSARHLARKPISLRSGLWCRDRQVLQRPTFAATRQRQRTLARARGRHPAATRVRGSRGRRRYVNRGEFQDRPLHVGRHLLARAERRGAADQITRMARRLVRCARRDVLRTDRTCELTGGHFAIAVHQDDERRALVGLHDERLDDRVLAYARARADATVPPCGR